MYWIVLGVQIYFVCVCFIFIFFGGVMVVDGIERGDGIGLDVQPWFP